MVKATREAPADIIFRLLARRCGVQREDLRPSIRLEEDLGLRSIDAAELIAVLEEALDVEIDIESLGEAPTVGGVVALVERMEQRIT